MKTRRHQALFALTFLTSVLITLISGNFTLAQEFQAGDLVLPESHKSELIAKNLVNPRMLAFDEKGRVLIAVAGDGGTAQPKVVRIESDGAETVLAQGSDFGDQLPLSSVGYHDGKIYLGHGGVISVLEQDGKVFRNIVKGLPGEGDYSVNQMVFQGSVMYFTIGTVTNSGVVGEDNLWLEEERKKELHDIPCRDIKITGEVYTTGEVKTSPYSPYSKTQPDGTVIKGDTRCNGAILKANIDGSDLKVYAWGLRNPQGLEIGPDGLLYTTNNAIQKRGSRGLEGAVDCLYKVEEGAWYGWPDFDCGAPITANKETKLKFIIKDQPTKTPSLPIVKFNPSVSANGFDFAPSNDWGNSSEAFLGLGTKVVKVDISKGEISDFIVNRTNSSGGFKKLADVSFGPEGAMYVVDEGAVWKISRINHANPKRSFYDKFGLSMFMSILQTIILIFLTFLIGKEKNQPYGDLRKGALQGLVAGIGSLAFAIIIATLFLKNAWYGPVQLFDLIQANPDTLSLKVSSVLLGSVIFLIISAILGAAFTFVIRTKKLLKILLASLLFGMTSWALVQYLILPHFSLKMVERSFSLSGFLMVYLFYGLAMGYLTSEEQIKKLFNSIESDE